jgi:hypothetical protein
MPGLILHSGATVQCSHAGRATPTATNSRVTVDGQPTVLITASYSVAGCALPPPPAGNGPCVTAQWMTGATRITSNGQPVLLADSQSMCTPTATPLTIVETQTGVKGT